MSLVFNMVGGAGGSAELPAIYATYPEGSVCTCSNGTKTYTAKDTSGYWLFAGLGIGTWIVTATDPTAPTNTVSQTVEITTEGQSVSVVLSFGLWLYKGGNQYTAVTGGWDTAGSSATATLGANAINVDVPGQSNIDAWASAFTKSNVDITKYKTLKVNQDWVKTLNYEQNAAVLIGIYNSKPNSLDVAVNFVASISNGASELDVSKITGKKYIGILGYIAGDGGNQINLQVDEVVLK